jgi:hypothetical protein
MGKRPCHPAQDPWQLTCAHHTIALGFLGTLKIEIYNCNFIARGIQMPVVDKK